MSIKTLTQNQQRFYPKTIACGVYVTSGKYNGMTVGEVLEEIDTEINIGSMTNEDIDQIFA